MMNAKITAFLSGLRILHTAAVYTVEYSMMAFVTDSQGNKKHESWHIEDTHLYVFTTVQSC